MSIEEDIAFLSSVPTLNLLGHDALRIIAIGAEVRELRAGEILFNLGEVSDAGFVVQHGTVKLTSSRIEGSHEVIAGRGTLLGEYALLAETKRPGTAMAMEPSTVLRISRSLFLKTMEGFPRAAERLRGMIASRTSAAIDDIAFVQRTLRAQDPTD